MPEEQIIKYQQKWKEVQGKFLNLPGELKKKLEPTININKCINNDSIP